MAFFRPVFSGLLTNRSELDYSVDSSVSKRMTETIRFVLANRNSQAGEASSEFLLALVSGKLQLDRKDLDLILADLDGYDLNGWNLIFFNDLKKKSQG